ncbi:MAG: type IX secretion system membrane protein PorP/SprF [Anditalea sp.]
MEKPIYLYICVFLLNCFHVIPAFSQQDAQFTQYMYNGIFYNPAFSGNEEGYQFSALHRSQWSGYTTSAGAGGAPSTQLLSVSGGLERYNLGFGLVFVNEEIGATSNQEANISLAYHYSIGRGILSIGASAGAFSSTMDYDLLELVNPDLIVPEGGSENQMNTNFSVGAVYDRGNFYLGLSSRHLNEPHFDFGEGELGNQLKNHNYLLAGYRINTFALWSIEPSVLLKSVEVNNFSYDVSVIATYNNRVSGGLAYRGEESASVILGYSLLKDNSLRLGYAFDLVIGGLEAKSPSSHELMLTYNLPQVRREFEKIIQRTPRYRF